MRPNIYRILLCLVLLMGIGTTKAFAADYLYVITDGSGNYLANSSGNMINSTSFDPKTCVWTCSGDGKGTLVNSNYYLQYKSSSSLTITSTSKSATTWTISNNNVSYTSRSTKYDISYSSSSWSVNSTQSAASSIYSVTKLTTEAVFSMTLNYDSGRKQGENVFEREGDTRDYTIDLSYTPAYNTYSWTTSDNATMTYYAATDDSYVSETAPDVITEATSYKWTSDHEENITFDDDESAQATATYETKLDEDADVTITATATIEKSASSFMTQDITLTATDTVALKSRYLVDLQYKVGSSSLYIGETTKITYAGWYDQDNTTVTFTSSNTDVAEVSTDGVITAKGVGTGGTDAVSVVITAATSQTDDYEASTSVINITVKKHPTAMTLQYDKSALTYGDAAPALTGMTLTDTFNNTELTSGVTYTSSDLCVNVNATTGELTINKAGTAVITAEYLGDDTHVEASASYTITVSKAATTLSFEQDSYIAQLTKDFTSPVATLSPAGVGTVTYSYTSTPENLITLDATTGAVTLGEEQGTATVTATFAGNDCYEASTASYVLTVTSKEFPDFSFSINGNELYVEQTITATATTNSTAGITYASSNEDILTVTDEGKITAIGEGTAYVRITSVEDDTYMAVNASYPITVKRWPTKIELTYASASYYTDHEGDIAPQSVMLHETVNNTRVDDLNNLVTYSTEDNNVLTVNASTGHITLLGKGGSAVITVTYAGTSKYAPASAEVVISVKAVTTPGTFIRLKDAAGNYLSSDGSTVNASSATADASSIIWYGEDRSLLFYACGLYLKDATPSLADVVNKGVRGTNFTFTHTQDNFTISDGTNTLTSNGSTEWTMEAVDYLPVTFNSAGYGYATFFCPVELSCPAGVVAYYPTASTSGSSDSESVITLKSVTGGYIPHNTPVVLQTNYVGTYNFYIVEEEEFEFSDLWDGLQGTVSAINTASVYSGTQWPYALQPLKSSEAVGFYPWKSDKHTTIPGFRCYIPGATASSAKGFRFVMDDGTATGIDGITATSSADAPIYNLQGISVGTDLQSLPAGVYIQSGRKVVKE